MATSSSHTRSISPFGGQRFFSAAVLACFLLLCRIHPARSVSDKCSACRAVAGELEMELANEKPRNHLDMRHRLDSRGQREGKLIDYKGSELRVVELLEGLCARMSGYTFEKTGPGKGKWLKMKNISSVLEGSDRQEAEAYAKQMTTYCGRLLEETEEELEERIKSGSVKVGEVEKTLCWELSENCSSEIDDEDTVETSREITESDGEL